MLVAEEPFNKVQRILYSSTAGIGPVTSCAVGDFA